MVEVVDFGIKREQESYIYLLDEQMVNAFYKDDVSSTEADANNLLGSFCISDSKGKSFVAFNTPEKIFRYRTNNQCIRRFDEKVKRDEEGNLVCGHIYAAKTAATDVTVTIELEKNDILELYLGSNGKESEYTLRYPDGRLSYIPFYNRANIEKNVIYATMAGTYTIWCSANERLVVSKIVRKRPPLVNVSGKISYKEGQPDNFQIVFENLITREKTVADTVRDSYKCNIVSGYSYRISVADAFGYIVSENVVDIANDCDVTKDIMLYYIELVKITGRICGLDKHSDAVFVIEGKKDQWFQPEICTNEDGEYSLILEKGVEYKLVYEEINDYEAKSDILVFNDDCNYDIVFSLKEKYPVNIRCQEGFGDVTLVFTNVWEVKKDGKSRYSYQYKLGDNISLRNGQYKLTLGEANKDITLSLLPDIVIKDIGVSVEINLYDNTVVAPEYEYKPVLEVGIQREFQNIGDAIDAVRHMYSRKSAPVTISIDPGNYEEMLVIDVENVTLVNSSKTPSNKVCNKGVDIEPEAVRVTSYYGHGYTYYSMDENCKYNKRLLEINKANGYYSMVNPGSGMTRGSYWNTTVYVCANGFCARDIIFENSFNQYMSKKACEDVIIPQAGAKEGSVPRSEMKYGDTSVQDIAYLERAAALAFTDKVENIRLTGCRIIGRQDTLYGGDGVKAYFDKCSIYGSVDYIFGGMTAVFDNCELIINISDGDKENAFIVAPAQNKSRGFLMWKCHIMDTVKGVDTASKLPSKPVYFGRPWAAKTGEAVFYETVIDSVVKDGKEVSIISAEGWNDSLSGSSERCFEYNTFEKEDNSKSRAAWAKVLEKAVLPDETVINPDAFA